jgi:hypothetical protein
MPTDEEITAAMRRFHQMRREVVLGMIGIQQENGTPPNQTEVNELLTQIKQTDEMMKGTVTTLPIHIPLK